MTIEEATQDPLDMAILSGAKEKGLQITVNFLHFTPFDPALRGVEALIRHTGNIERGN